MKTYRHRPSTMMLGAAVLLMGAAGETHARSAGQLPLAEGAVQLVLEQNATDQDAELLFVVDPGLEIKTVSITGPERHRQIVNVSGTARPTIGIGKFTIETAEPSLAAVKAEYPAGEYDVVVTTLDNKRYVGHAELSHEMPEAPAIDAPLAGAGDVALNGTVISWQPAAGAEHYTVELENVDAGITLKADIPAGETSFSVPPNWLLGGQEHALNVLAISGNGNVTGTEVFFTTATP